MTLIPRHMGDNAICSTLMRNLELRFPFSFDIVAYISLIHSINILLSCNKVIITGESVLLMRGWTGG